MHPNIGRGRGRNGGRNTKDILGANGVLLRVYPQGGSNRDGLNRADGGSDVRSGLSGLPACVPGQLLRMPLHVAASVQRVGIGPRGTVRHQSIFCERASARGLLAASPRLLKLIL